MKIRLSTGIVLALAISACGTGQPTPDAPYVQARDAIAAGEYLTTTAGCNDCHTVGWMEQGNAIPLADRLTGMPIGWRGPWGTSYPANLRLSAATTTPGQWVAMIRARNGNPPMPWMNLHAMNDRDLQAIHAFLQSLGSKGERMPAYVPPDREPSTPFFVLVPQGPGMTAPTAPTTMTETPH